MFEYGAFNILVAGYLDIVGDACVVLADVISYDIVRVI